MSGLTSPPAAYEVMAMKIVVMIYRLEDEGQNEAEECERLSKCEAEERDRLEY
jgi:hypothetical protein